MPTFRTLALRAIIALLVAAPAFAAEPVNLNTADAATLDRELKGVGPSRAAAIVAYRQAHGPFKSVDELALVQGIGQRVIDDNREVLKVELKSDKGAKPAGSSSTGNTAPQKPAAKPSR